MTVAATQWTRASEGVIAGSAGQIVPSVTALNMPAVMEVARGLWFEIRPSFMRKLRVFEAEVLKRYRESADGKPGEEESVCTLDDRDVCSLQYGANLAIFCAECSRRPKEG
jgi:hypothetical protein